jgi:REP element-mobilizing transposase RayT
MPRRARKHAESEIYHVMLRGVNRDAVFLEDGDYERFLDALVRTKEASGCQVFAYCLMTNHVHLVLRSPAEPIGDVVRRLGVRYVGWFNHKYGRVGHLFQDRFRSAPVDDDAYLLTLVRYVWHNPVEAGLVNQPEDYRWSSRRFLGLPHRLIDERELLALAPMDALVAAPPASPALLAEPPMRTGPAERYSDARSAELLRQICGAGSPDDFRRLDAAAQHRAVCELRMRSMPYAQIARVAGLSPSGARRLHIAGLASTDEDIAERS